MNRYRVVVVAVAALVALPLLCRAEVVGGGPPENLASLAEGGPEEFKTMPGVGEMQTEEGIIQSELKAQESLNEQDRLLFLQQKVARTHMATAKTSALGAAPPVFYGGAVHASNNAGVEEVKLSLAPAPVNLVVEDATFSADEQKRLKDLMARFHQMNLISGILDTVVIRAGQPGGPLSDSSGKTIVLFHGPNNMRFENRLLEPYHAFAQELGNLLRLNHPKRDDLLRDFTRFHGGSTDPDEYVRGKVNLDVAGDWEETFTAFALAREVPALGYPTPDSLLREVYGNSQLDQHRLLGKLTVMMGLLEKRNPGDKFPSRKPMKSVSIQFRTTKAPVLRAITLTPVIRDNLGRVKWLNLGRVQIKNVQERLATIP